MSSLVNYRALVARVDELCDGIMSLFSGDIACRQGCDSCCRHLSIFRVEGESLNSALSELSPEVAAGIRARGADATPDSPCPLLHEGRCLLYHARPIICRTHGLPLLLSSDDGQRVDFCPMNFRGTETIHGDAVIDLDRLNTALAAINALFLKDQAGVPTEERITIGEALQTNILKTET